MTPNRLSAERLRAASAAKGASRHDPAPGPFLTDIAEAWDPSQREAQPNALGRAGQPDEIITAALMLASPASTFTTGALVRVDGGLH
jgi:NAD(P)-dependent dehydrogenase (short-subunit alcohol dehydrogenase family)